MGKQKARKFFICICFYKAGFVYLANAALENLESRTPKLGMDVMKKHQKRGRVIHLEYL